MWLFANEVDLAVVGVLAGERVRPSLGARRGIARL